MFTFYCRNIIGLRSSALDIAGGVMFYMVYALFDLSKIQKLMNTETYLVQGFSMKDVEHIPRVAISCNGRTLTSCFFQGQSLFTFT